MSGPGRYAGMPARWVAACCGLVAAGCGAAGGVRPGGRFEEPVRVEGTYAMEVPLSRTGQAYATALPAPPERAWAELPAVYAQLEIPLDHADAAARRLGNEGWLARRIEGERLSEYVDCGEGPLGAPHADRYEVRLAVASRVVPSGSASTIETTVAGTARDRAVSGGSLPCFSTGTLEARIAALLQLRLMGAGAEG